MWCNMHKNKYVKNDNSFSCEKAQELMFAELDGETSADESEKLRQHMEHCEKCRKEFFERKAIMEAIRDTKWSAPSNLKPNVMALIDSVKQDGKTSCHGKIFWQNRRNSASVSSKKHKIFARSSIFIPLGTAVAACAAVVLVIFNHGLFEQNSFEQADFSLNAPLYKAACTSDGSEFQQNEQFEMTNARYSAAPSSSETYPAADLPDNGYVSEAPSETLEMATVQNDGNDLSGVIKQSVRAQSNVLDLFAADSAQNFPDAAVLVCSREQLVDLIPEDSIMISSYVASEQGNQTEADRNIQNSQNNSDDPQDEYPTYKSDVCVVSSDSAEYAASVFASYVKLLDDQGADYRMVLPDRDDFTEFCIVLVEDTPIGDYDESPELVVESHTIDAPSYE